jgi:hypothetical protein
MNDISHNERYPLSDTIEREGGDDKERKQNQGTTKGSKGRQQGKTNTTPKNTAEKGSLHGEPGRGGGVCGGEGREERRRKGHGRLQE